jgi:hypothetical protein
MLNRLFLAFSAGNIGALLNSLAVWLAGLMGISQALGVNIAPPLTATWLYPRLVWGGLWGLLLVIPSPLKAWQTGLIASLLPSAVQCFIVFPLKAQKGVGGLALGALTPVLVLLFNAIWGVSSAYLLQWTQQRSR